jgi:glycosyltransferase involved in cell wall biosynthesis
LAALCAGKRRVAYFYENPDTSTFRYRVFNMVEALNSAPELGISASWFSMADFTRVNRFIDQADALVLCRTRYGPVVERIFARARLRQIPILFDVDDLVFDHNYVSLILDSLDQDIESERILDNWFAYAGRFEATLRRCDGAITTNQYLADRIAEFVPGMVPRIVPNFLNRLQQETSRVIWEAKLKSKFMRDDNINVGYFSGTPTHNHDFQIVTSALADIMDQDPRVVVRIVGFLDSKQPLARHRDRVEVLPLQDFLNLQRLIGEVEVNVAPLQNNVFTNCKSELKYFEAAIAGTLTIASPTFTFRNAIRDGQNGFLSAAQEWESKLRTALDAIDSPDQYAALVETAYDHASNTYGWDRFAPRIEAAVFGL